MARQSKPVIQTHKLTKYYGRTRGVEELDLAVESGEVFGFLGPNGAGKSTTIHLLLGFRRPTSGRSLLFGKTVTPISDELRREVGFLAGEPAFYGDLTARETCLYLGNLRGGVAMKQIEELAARFDLDLDRRVKQLSRGNKQKVGLVQAFMHEPKLLILDEPTAGLDPLMQREFYRLVREAKDRGQTVFLSSHVMSEVEAICDRVGIIRDGHLIEVNDIASLKEAAERLVHAVFVAKPSKAAFAKLASVREVSVVGHHLHARIRGSVDPLIRELARHELKSLSIEPVSLEELFFNAYDEAQDA